MALKPDAEKIRAVLKSRAEELNLGSRNWWLRYAFHFTDIRNAAGILTEERIYSRALATEKGLMVVENADVAIIAQSAHLTNNHVRLYFRPRTPTQYRNEGMRPIGQRPQNNAHCPVPVFFLFHLPELLVLRGVRFTDGAANWDAVEVGEDAKALKKLQWKDIYSSGGMGDRALELTFLRRAEVFVENSLSFEHLDAIVCRSGPERDTLLNLVSPEVRDKWRKKVYLPGRAEIFEGHWTYVESVRWVGDTITISFFPGSSTPGPFTVKTLVTDLDSGKVLVDGEQQRTFAANENRFRIILRKDSPARRVEVRIILDGCLAYCAPVEKDQLLSS